MPLDSTIYVSMSNPLGEPAFKPSPTKPIPRWMQYLPEYRKTYHPEESHSPTRRSTSALPKHPEQDSDRSRASSGVSATTLCPTRTHTPVSTPPPLSPRTSSKSFASSPFDDLADPVYPPLEIRTTRQQPISWVSHEPLKRPSSRIGFKQGHERSETEASAYLTPPEFSVDEGDESGSPIQAGATRVRRRRHEGLRPQHRPQSPLSAVVDPSPTLSRTHQHDAVRPLMRTPPTLSSEYLDKYRPIRSPSPKPMAGFREPMAMIEAMRRDSMATSSSASTAREPETPTRTSSGRMRQETLQPSQIQDQVRAGRQRRRPSAGGLQVGPQTPLDGAESLHSATQQGLTYSPGKRRNLQSELKKLFGK
jgi:hypothetical protein